MLFVAWIGAPGVGQGYVNLATETAIKFINKTESLNALPGTKIYRTVDQAPFTAAGDIRFFGRIDKQIKISLAYFQR